MNGLGDLALRLSEATDIATAAERLAEQVHALAPEAAVRVYLLGPGDRCSTCPRRPQCPSQARCFHLEATLGTFASPVLHDQRVPEATAWGDAHQGLDAREEAVPAELARPEPREADAARLIPMEAGGETVGVLGIRATAEVLASIEEEVRVAAFLTASAIRLLRSLDTANLRFEQLLLVNELGRKVNAILNDELLLRQAAVDIHRTFGFHNVMIFMVDESRSHMELKAQASRFANPTHGLTRVGVGEGVIGRVYRTGRAEVVDDVGAIDDFIRWFDDTQSEIAVPIQIGGVVEGVLNVESDRIGAFGPSQRLVLETVSNQLAIAIENARLFGMVKEREDRYRTLVESSPGAVLHLDAEGRIIYANPAVSSITGHEKGHILSRVGGLEELAVPADRTHLLDAVQAALRGVPCHDLEFHLVHEDGTPRFVSASLQPLVGEHGDPKGVVVLARDRTREKQLQDKLNQSEKLSSIGTLVSGVAHELNNPLAGILGFAQLIQARPPEQWARKDIENIETNARRCQRIVENLLQFARQQRMTRRRANLNDVIEKVLDLNEYQFRMDNIRIERDFDKAVPAIPLDVNKWQQVFINLANNAHQALVESKAEERFIRFETRVRTEGIVILVSDSGPGIPEKDRLHIFDPFFTTKDSGTGLGLGICFGIVNEHGGRIELDESYAKGTRFVIELPLEQGSESLPELRTQPVRAVSESGEGRCVLVVDDDPYVCDVVARSLQNHAYEVVVANDGAQALQRLEERRFDAILTDVRMPGPLDGIDLYDQLAGDPETQRRIVFMTGNLLDSRTMQRLKDLPVRCVEKPFDIHKLASLMHEVSTGGTGADIQVDITAEAD